LLAKFITKKHNNITYDKDDRAVYLAENEWQLKMARQDYPKIEFHFTSESKTE
jgi:peptide chain release factor 3